MEEEHLTKLNTHHDKAQCRGGKENFLKLTEEHPTGDG